MDNEPINIQMLHTRAIPTVFFFFCDAYLDNVNCFMSAIRNKRTFKGALVFLQLRLIVWAIQMLFNSEIAISSHVC